MSEKDTPITPAEYKQVTEEMYKQNLELVRLNKEVEELNENLTRANDGQANLIHIINHQIKGYISKSRNIFSELLEEPMYGPLNEKAKPIIKEGFNSLTEGVGFVQQILNASNVEKGTLTYIMNPFDYRELVETVFREQTKLAEQKNLAYTIHIEDGAYTVNGDKLQLHEAIRNLIDNSINYTQSGGVAVSLVHHESHALLAIKDTGVGISDDDKKHLFMKGGHGKNSIKINVNSTGYGLSFVKGVVEAHKGTVSAMSDGEGKGSTFTIELPLQ